MTSPPMPVPPAAAAFLRGAGRRALLFVRVQAGGHEAAAGQALQVASSVFATPILSIVPSVAMCMRVVRVHTAWNSTTFSSSVAAAKMNDSHRSHISPTKLCYGTDRV